MLKKTKTLTGKKMAKSRNLPGVTKSLMWVRLGGVEGSQENCIELLDSPGIIPARQLDQEGDSLVHCTAIPYNLLLSHK